MACTKCNTNKNASCSCKTRPRPCPEQCEISPNTDCVIYNRAPNRSNLSCFLGLNNGVTLTKILETLDKKLCLSVSPCARLKLGLGFETDISMAVTKMLDYICELEDVKVKVTKTDKSSGYLFDKISKGDCVITTLVKDNAGNEHLKIELDFTCIETKLACCGGNNTTITIQGANSVCGNEKATLTALTNCSGVITWSNGLTGPTIQASAGSYYATCSGRQSNIIEVISTGNCGCTEVWRDQLPVSIFCGKPLGYDNCKKYIKQVNQCNTNERWVIYTGSNADGSQCEGCGSALYTAIRSQTFTRNNCASGCTASSVEYSKTYTSSQSQTAANLLSSTDNSFITEGQAKANAEGTCTGINCNNTGIGSQTNIRTENFTRNDCATGCTASVVSYSKTYTGVTASAALAAREADNTTFNTEGQANANANGTCTNCPSGCTPITTITINEQ